MRGRSLAHLHHAASIVARIRKLKTEVDVMVLTETAVDLFSSCRLSSPQLKPSPLTAAVDRHPPITIISQGTQPCYTSISFTCSCNFQILSLIRIVLLHGSNWKRAYRSWYQDQDGFLTGWSQNPVDMAVPCLVLERYCPLLYFCAIKCWVSATLSNYLNQQEEALSFQSLRSIYYLQFYFLAFARQV